MKKLARKLFSVIMIVAMAVTVAPTNLVAEAASIKNPVVKDDASNTATGKSSTWDCIWMGSYPQKEVVANVSQTGIDSDYLDQKHDLVIDATLYGKLQKATNWQSNTTTIDGVKYLRMRATDATATTSGDAKFYHWSDTKTYHYFKFEPIKWRVLKINADQTALVVADECIEERVYNTSNVGTTWATSTLRTWLNNQFIQNAFTQNEKNAIVATQLTTEDNQGIDESGNPYGPISGGGKTTDKVFLLQVSDYTNPAIAAAYGFFGEGTKVNYSAVTKSTSYVKAMGVYSELSTANFAGYAGYCYQWSRTPGLKQNEVVHICRFGFISRSAAVTRTERGVRPAMTVNLKASNVYSYAGTVTAAAKHTVNEVAPQTNPQGHTHIEAAAVKENVKEASCSKAGSYDSVVYCTTCKAVVSRTSVTIPAKGHEWSSWTTTKAATVLATGAKVRTCTVCGTKETASIKKLTATIKLSSTKKTLKKGKNFTLKITNLAKGDAVKSVTSSKKSIATVKKSKTNQYKITAKKKGKATITVKLKSGKTAKCVVTVR